MKNLQKVYCLKLCMFFVVSVFLLISQNIDFITIVSVVQLILAVLLLEIKKLGIGSFSAIFLYVMFFFHIGQLLCVTVFPKEYDYSFWLNSTEKIIISAKLYILAVVGYILGVLFVPKHRIVLRKSKSRKHYISESRVRNYGLLFLLVGLGPKLYIDISKVIIAKQFGYMATYGFDLSGVGIISTLVYPGVLMLLLANKENKRVCKLFMTLVIAYEAFCMMSGNRYMGISFIIVLIYVYYNFIEKIDFKQCLILIAVAMFGIIFMNIIQQTRLDSTEVSGSDLLSGFKMLSDICINFVYDLGGTLNSVILAVDHFPNKVNYFMGKSYFLFLPFVIPFFSRFVDPKYVMYIYSFSYHESLGGSCIGEAYCNFGYCGIVVFVVVGYIISQREMKNNAMKLNDGYVSLDLISDLTMMIFLLVYIRGYFISLKSAFYLCVLMTIIKELEIILSKKELAKHD